MNLEPAKLWTIGHSTRTADDLLALLEAHGVQQVADVRTVPRSRRHPHFNSDALCAFLTHHAKRYRHFPALGGLRKPEAHSRNTAWRHPGFRGYADYMQSDAFCNGLTELEAFARVAPTAVMCAEAVWWQCHRRLLADALVVRGADVRHIISPAPPNPHQLSEFARVHQGRVTYPGLL